MFAGVNSVANQNLFNQAVLVEEKCFDFSRSLNTFL